MKIFIVIVVLFVVLQMRDDIVNFVNPPPDLSAFEGEVLLYSTAWCGYCKKARSLFEKSGVSFVEYDIEKSQLAAEEYRQLGGRGVPLIVINEQVLQGFDRSKILEQLTAELPLLPAP